LYELGERGGRVADLTIEHPTTHLGIFFWYQKKSCLNLVDSTHAILITKLNFHNVHIWYRCETLWLATYQYNLWSTFSIYCDCTIHCTLRNPTIAHLAIKITISHTRTWVLLHQDDKVMNNTVLQ
jgi:hypothetical protein